jgi:uroporphyrinogen decarboxylase
MNNRDLWLRLMNYETVDRVPVMHWSTWRETHEEWIGQGLPPEVERRDGEARFLGVTPFVHRVGLNVKLYPQFEEVVIAQTARTRTIRQGDGVIAVHNKFTSSPPHFLDYTLKPDGTGWDEYKKRLQPDAARIPKDLAEQIRVAGSTDDQPIAINTGSLVGWIRDWLGVEGLAYLCADRLDLFQEMVETITTLVLWELDILLPRVKVDCGWCWEDICFRTGPLINPDIFRRICVPNYQRISQKLHDHGVNLHVVDCDGMIEHLAGLWLEGGVNVMFPVEIGAWNYDPQTLRKKFGRNLRLFGGIDKLELTRGRGAIDAEIARRVPLMKEGGYVPLPDHFIIPGTPLEDYRYYLAKLGEVRL